MKNKSRPQTPRGTRKQDKTRKPEPNKKAENMRISVSEPNLLRTNELKINKCYFITLIMDEVEKDGKLFLNKSYEGEVGTICIKNEEPYQFFLNNQKSSNIAEFGIEHPDITHICIYTDEGHTNKIKEIWKELEDE